jgi:hypothetical protein
MYMLMKQNMNHVFYTRDNFQNEKYNLTKKKKKPTRPKVLFCPIYRILSLSQQMGRKVKIRISGGLVVDRNPDLKRA